MNHGLRFAAVNQFFSALTCLQVEYKHLRAKNFLQFVSLGYFVIKLLLSKQGHSVNANAAAHLVVVYEQEVL